MRVKVEEGVALVADEVVATAWATTCDADRLRHVECGLEGRVVDRCDAVDS